MWDFFFFFSSRRRHTRFDCDWSSDVCSSDLPEPRENIERPTSNTERRRERGLALPFDVRRWMFDVGCSSGFMRRVPKGRNPGPFRIAKEGMVLTRSGPPPYVGGYESRASLALNASATSPLVFIISASSASAASASARASTCSSLLFVLNDDNGSLAGSL